MRKKAVRRLLVEQLEARTLLTAHFVDPTGSDSNDGSAAHPWLTLQHAADSAQPGDVVTVDAGNYTGFNITHSGTAAAPITFQANPGAVINHPQSWGGLLFGINASGPSYNIIDGFTITAQPTDPEWDQGIRMGGIFPGGAIPNWATGNIIRNNTVQLRVVPVGDQTSNHDQLPIFTSWQDGLVIQNNTASGGWDSGIYVSNSAKNYTIRGNTVFNVGGNGIHNNGDASQGGPGINTNAVIEDNVIHDVGFGIGGQAVSCDGLQNSRIQNNLIYNAWDKGISLYVVNASAGSKNNIVVNNTVVTGVGSSVGVAMRVDGSSTGNAIYNNIFLNAVTGSWSYEVDTGSETIDYNIVASTPQLGVSLQNWQTSWGNDVHGFTATLAGLFVSPSTGNYQLKSGSPAIGAGTATDAPSVDLLGNPRPSGSGYDIGAYEFQPTAQPPGSPSSLNAVGGAAQIALTWTGGSNDFSYNVYRSTVSGFAPSAGNLVGHVSSAAYTDTSVTPGTTYFYVVTGLNSASQESSPSGQASATAQAGTPGIPTSLLATSGPLQVALSWKVGNNDVSYNVYRSTVSGFTPAAGNLIASPSTNAFTDTNVTAGTTYFYLVNGVNSTGQVSSASSQASATAQAAAPGIPTNLLATAGVLQIALTWTAGNNDATYKLYRATASGFTPSAANLIASPSTTSFTDSTAVAGTTYFYVVAGVNTTGQTSAASGQASAAAQAAAPGVPTNLTATGAALQVALTWTAASNDATYKVYRSTVSGFTPSAANLIASPSTTSFTDSSVSGGTTYFYLVAGVNTTGQISSPSSQASATAQAGVPGTPTGLAATGGALQVALTWNAGANDVSYSVYRSAVSGFTPSATNLIANPGTTSLTDTSVTAGTTYFYLVTGANSTGQSSTWSSQASATAQAPAPGSPTSLVATGGALQVALTWTAGTNDATFRVYRSTVSGFTASAATLIASPSTNAFTDSNVTAGTTYFYLVSGVNSTGQASSPSSQASAFVQAPAPNSPTNLSAAGGVLQVALTWTAGSNDASYKVYRSTVSGFTASASNLVASPTGSSYTDPQVTAGTTYFYLVTGLNTTGQESSPTSEGSATVQAAAPPSTPTNVSATSGILKIVLNWTAASGDTDYKVYRSTVSGFTISASTLLANPTATSYTDTNLAAGSTYYYLVTGVNVANQGSAPSGQVSATAQGQPAADLQFSAASYSVKENGGAAVITVTRTSGLNGTHTVSYATRNGTAIEGVNYLGAFGTLTFNSGEASKTFTVGIVDDGKVRGLTTINLSLANGSAGVSFGGPSTATLTIQETDGTHTERWLAQVYLDVLHRPVDDGGLAYFDSQISLGMTLTQVVQAMENSTEYHTDLVQSFYQRFLRRAADPTGLRVWVNFLNGGGTDEQLEAAIIGSTEYFNNQGGGTNNGFLSALFRDVLNRAIDSVGLSGLGQDLASGMSRQEVAQAVFTSSEARQDLVVGYYQQFLRRPADPVGLAAFTTQLQQGSSDEQIAAILIGSAEYFGLVL
jgi:fibronectin type 3 domain-containing protein